MPKKKSGTYLFSFLLPEKGLYWYSFDPTTKLLTIFNAKHEIIHTEKLEEIDELESKV